MHYYGKDSNPYPFTSNMRIFIHGLCATPERSMNALCEHCHQHDLSHIGLIYLVTINAAPPTSLFMSKNVRDGINERISEYTTLFVSEIPLFISKDHNIDVSLYVSPPDSARFRIRSLGVSVDITRSNLLVDEVNKHILCTHHI